MSSPSARLSALGMNRVYLTGTVAAAPDLRASASGAPLLRLCIAVPSTRKVGDEWVEVTDFHRVTAHGTDATWLSTNARKGDSIAVEGSIRSSKWTDANGVEHFDTAIVLDLMWLSAKKGAA